MNDFPSIADHIVVWIFGIIFPFLSGLQSEKLNGEIVFNTETRKKLYLGDSLMLCLSGLSIIGIWLFKERPFQHLGFREPLPISPAVLIILLLFLIGYSLDMFFTKRKLSDPESNKTAEWYEKASFLPEEKKELKYYLLLCLCAGVFEEIIYRGFMVTYFQSLEQNNFPYVALLAPSILFSLAHYYQGWQAVFKITIFSTMLGFIYILTKSIYLNMFIHFMVDLVSGIMIMQQKK